MVFSVEQLRCGRTEAPPQTVAPEDCLMADALDSNHDGESPAVAISRVWLYFCVHRCRRSFFGLLKVCPRLKQVNLKICGAHWFICTVRLCLVLTLLSFLSLSDFVKLSFCSPSKLDEAPERPQDLCTPQLQQLLAPIFDLMTPPTSSGASSCETEPVNRMLLFSFHFILNHCTHFFLFISLLCCVLRIPLLRRRRWTPLRWRSSLLSKRKHRW